MLRAAIYARVSTDEQAEEGHSIDAQLRENRAFCERKGWSIAAEYVDDGYSARTLERPRMQELIADIEDHKVDVIVVHKLDRLSRSVIDTLLLLNDLSKKGVSFACVADGDFDFTTPIGKVVLVVLAAFAQYFIDNLIKETKKGKRERAFKGFYNGTLPFGYQRVPREQGGVPVLDPKNVEGYRLAVRLCAEGYTVHQITLKLNANGYRTTGNWGRRPFSVDTVLPMIKNKFYLGLVSYKGEWMPGKHEPAIDGETWERAQEQLRSRAGRHETTKANDRIYPLRKLLRCSTCGRPMRGHFVNGDRHYRDLSRDYGEKCSEVQSVRAKVLEDQIGEYLSQISLPKDWREKILSKLSRGKNDEQAKNHERKQLELQLARLKQLFILNDLTEQEYRAQRAQIQQAIDKLTSSGKPVRDLELAAKLLEDFRKIWEKATDAERLRLLQASLTKAYVKNSQIVAIEPRPAIYPLLAMANATGGSDGRRLLSGNFFLVILLNPATQ